MIDEARACVERLRQRFPDARVVLREFDSGSFYVNVFVQEGFLQMIWTTPQQMFGVDTVTEADAFSNYYRFTSTDFAAAEAELVRLASEASRSTPGTLRATA